MTDEKLLMAVHKAISVYLNYTGDTKCFDWSSDDDNAPDIGFAGWDIQVNKLLSLFNIRIYVLSYTLMLMTYQ